MRYKYDKIVSTYEKYLAGTKYQFDSTLYTRTGNPGIVRGIKTTLSVRVYQQENVRKYNYVGFHFYFGEKTKAGYPIMFACTNNIYVNSYDVPNTDVLYTENIGVYVKHRNCKTLVQFIKDCPKYVLTQVQQNMSAFVGFSHEVTNIILNTLKQEVQGNEKH
mgnify:CR=1 FL=1